MEQGKTAGRPAIEESRYHNKIEEWLNEGKRLDEITAATLQKEVGGQYRKVVTILDRFKAGYETKELSELPELPETLVNELNAMALSVWRQLWAAKTEEVNAAQELLEQDRAQFTELAEERLGVISDLEVQIEEADVAQQQLNNELVELKATSASQVNETYQLRSQLATANERGDQLQGRCDDREQARLQLVKELADLRDELARTQGKLENERGKTTDLAANVQAVKAELATANERGDQLQGRCDDREQARLQLVKELADLRDELASTQGKLENERGKATELAANVQAVQADLAKSMAESKQQAAENSVQQQQLETANNHATSLNAELAEAGKKAAALETESTHWEARAKAAEKRTEYLQNELLAIAKLSTVSGDKSGKTQ